MPCWPQGRRTSAVRLLSVLGGHLTYQALPGIAGGLIAILQAGDPPMPHDFFVYESPELGLLTPAGSFLVEGPTDLPNTLAQVLPRWRCKANLKTTRLMEHNLRPYARRRDGE